MTELCQLEGRTLKLQLAYFGPRVGYFGHIFLKISASISVFFKVSVAQRLVTSATNNIFPWLFLQLIED